MMRRISANLPDNFVPDSEVKQQESVLGSQDLGQYNNDFPSNSEEESSESTRRVASVFDEYSSLPDDSLPALSAEDQEYSPLPDDSPSALPAEDQEYSSLPDDSPSALQAEDQEYSPLPDDSLPALSTEDQEYSPLPDDSLSRQVDEKLKSRRIRPFTMRVPSVDEDSFTLQQERESIGSTLTEIKNEHKAELDVNSTDEEYDQDALAETESDSDQDYVIPRLPRAQLLYPGFQNAMEFLRENFKLPREIQLEQQKSSRTWLLSKLKKIESIEETASFAYSLSHKDQALLFPVLATLKKKTDIERLEEIILLLSNKSLYIHGWLTLQFAYPRSVVATTLTKLCLKLEDRTFSNQNYSAQKYHRSLRHASGGSGPEIIWSKISLITEISHPNSRHFISDIVDYYFESELDYQEFCRRYAIYTDLRLGIAISEKIDETINKEGTNFHLSKRFFSQD
ncbi:MAG TPA: hypothetical protein GXZ59_02325 [Clostridiaceae bacterium]|nr:hypothetical protein [Clostridiaceae bacterium]